MNTLPAPLPRPARAPHHRSPNLGAPRWVAAGPTVRTAAVAWLVAATGQTLARRVTTPPTKSDRPYATAEDRDRRITTAEGSAVSRARGVRRTTHPFRRTTANHAFGPPPENLTAVNSGCTS